jgi:uncharacterized membrane protein
MRKILSATILQYIMRVLVFELGLAIIVGAILLLREHTLNSFGNWMFWAGLIIIVLGASSLLGGWGITRSGLYQLGLSVSEEDISTRTKRNLQEEQSNFSFLQLCAGVGILAIIISGLV